MNGHKDGNYMPPLNVPNQRPSGTAEVGVRPYRDMGKGSREVWNRSAMEKAEREIKLGNVKVNLPGTWEFWRR